MRMRRRRPPRVACVLAVTLVLGIVPAAAAEPPAAASRNEATIAFADPVGDANYVNDQGVDGVPVDDAGLDTRPASLASADLVEGRYETTYTSVPEHDGDGSIVRVRRVPTGLRLRLRTAGRVAPSFGPTVSVELSADVAGCPMSFVMHARGPLSGEDDPPQRAELHTRSPSCPGGVTSYTEDVSLRLQGALFLLEYPFAALQAPGGPLLRPGDVIAADPGGTGATSSTVHGLPGGTLATGPIIDKASLIDTFVIGADVPPDIDCLESGSEPECLGLEPPPDSGEDLHAALLGSEDPTRSGRASTVDLAEEYGVYSFRPDAPWMTFGFDVAAAGFTESYVEINLAARIMENGMASEEWRTLEESFADWKILYGPADDPYRSVVSLFQDTPWGITVALPAEGVDRMTLLGGADVWEGEHVGLVFAVRGTNSPFFGEPFPDTFGAWMQDWTGGKRKVRLEADRWGRGVELVGWLSEQGSSFSYDVRRGVVVQDERRRTAGVAEPGTMRLAGSLETAGPALSETSLFYSAQADQDIALEWRTPTETRRATRSSVASSGASVSALSPDGGAGGYGLSLDVESGTERSSSVSYLHDVWSLDPVELFPGLDGRFTSDPPADPAVLTPGMTVAGPAPRLVVSLGVPARAN